METPGTSTGYCMARNRPARARSSTVMDSTSCPSSVTEPRGDLVLRVARDRVGERGLARAVRSHDRVGLAGVDGEVDALEDLLGPVLGGHRDVQVLDLQGGHGMSCSVQMLGDGELGLDGRLQPLPQLGDGDLAEDLAEEPADDQPPRDVLRDAAALQVEQLLVVEAAGGARVPGAGDLAGLDLQVGHRVGPGTGGEDEVAVELEGVGGLGRVADQHVADPHGAGPLALQGVLVVHPRAAVRLAVVDEQPLLQVLTSVGEAQCRRARRRRPARGRQRSG